jgi:hypothetical protein
MRAILLIGFVAMILSGCSEYRQSVESSASTPNRNVAVSYKGPDGFHLAVAKASEWCSDRFGKSDVHLLKDDRAAGRATFACEPFE